MKLGGPVELVGFGPEWQRPGAAPLEEGRGNQGTFSTTGPLSGELGPGSLQFSETWWGGGGVAEKEAQTNQNNNSNKNRASSSDKRDPVLGSRAEEAGQGCAPPPNLPPTGAGAQL